MLLSRTEPQNIEDSEIKLPPIGKKFLSPDSQMKSDEGLQHFGKNQLEEEMKSLRKKFTIYSECLNYPSSAEKLVKMYDKLKLHFIFFVDGRMILIIFNKNDRPIVSRHRRV